MGQEGRDLPSLGEVALTLGQIPVGLIQIEMGIQVAPHAEYSLEIPQGSYMNTWSHLNETHSRPAPNQEPLPLQVSSRLDKAIR